MTSDPDEVAGYRAGIFHAWAHPIRGRASSMPGFGGPHARCVPEDATDGFRRGWEEGLRSLM